METAQLQQKLDRYCENYLLCVRLSRNWSGAFGSDKALLEEIQQRAETIAALMAENDTILRASLFPVLEQTELIPPETETLLDAFAERMIDQKAGVDARLGLQVFRALLAQARAAGDTETILKRLYQCGMAYFSANYSLEPLEEYWKPNPYFLQMEAYLPQYDTLSDAARSCLLRGMHNRTLRYPLYTQQEVEQYVVLLQQERELFAEKRGQNPQFPWDRFEYARKRQVLRLLFAIRNGLGLQYAPLLVDTMRSLVPGEVDAHGAAFGNVQLQCQYMIARYHAGEITCRQLTDALGEIYASVDRSDTSVAGIADNMKTLSYLLYYLAHDDSRTHMEKSALAGEVYHCLNAYMEAYDFSGSNDQFMSEVNNLLSASRESRYDADYLAWSRRLMQLVHLPTYIHSEMVTLIAQAVAAYAADRRPEWLTDFPQNVDFLEYVRRSAFLHDIGKLSILEIVAQYSRRLFDEEFEILKLHPICGYQELMQHDGSRSYAVAALAHHLSRDGRSGYPRNTPVDTGAYHLVVDIIHIADCMDAATDDIGRCYARAKSLDTLLDEMDTMGENQYHPGILALLREPELHARIEQILDRQRKDLYVRSYRQISERSLRSRPAAVRPILRAMPEREEAAEGCRMG